MSVRTVGIEEEFLVFRSDEPRLLAAGPAVVAAADRVSEDGADFQKELKQAQVELATDPGTDLGVVAAELARRRGELIAAAADRAAASSPRGPARCGVTSARPTSSATTRWPRDSGPSSSVS